jgi:ADP-heptose:LPS heptosyltransferase
VHPPGFPSIQRVLVVRVLPGLGDLLCVVPALRALRAGLPSASITLLGLPWARMFVERFSSYIDDFLEFPGYPGIPERALEVRELPAFFAGVQRHRFDLAIQMHGSGITSNPFTMLLGARINAGFFLPGQYCPDEHYFLPYDEREPEVLRYLRLVESLGMPSRGEALEFPLREADVQALEAVPEARELRAGEYICIHPGAKDLARRWPAERFAAAGDALSARGYRVALTGTAAEEGLTRAVARRMRAPALNLAGRTDLGALAALLKGARLLVCNDTGVSHLAAALNVPSVVVFTATDPARWAPLDRALHRVVEQASISQTRRTALPGVDEVLSQAEDLIRTEMVYAI